jgi:accessory gene regulator protein AgrB
MPSKRKSRRLQRSHLKTIEIEAEQIVQEVRLKDEHRRKYAEILFGLIIIIVTGIGIAIALPNLLEKFLVLGPFFELGVMVLMLLYVIFTLRFKFFSKKDGE